MAFAVLLSSSTCCFINVAKYGDEAFANALAKLSPASPCSRPDADLLLFGIIARVDLDAIAREVQVFLSNQLRPYAVCCRR